MEAVAKAAIRGWFYMTTIAVVFGLWQRSFLAAVFMLLFLLFLEKMLRVLLRRG